MSNLFNHFSKNPTTLNISRSAFDRSFKHTTSFSAGKLVPFFLDEVLPGDTFKVSTNVVARLTTLVNPVMDNAYLDMYYFFVPHRLVWNKWEAFNGANDDMTDLGYWTQTTEYTVPTIKYTGMTVPANSVPAYMGVPIGKNVEFSALPIRSYLKIWNDWFRDQNVEDMAFYHTDSTNINLVSSSNGQTKKEAGLNLMPVSKYHDYLLRRCLLRKREILLICFQRLEVFLLRMIRIIRNRLRLFGIMIKAVLFLRQVLSNLIKKVEFLIKSGLLLEIVRKFGLSFRRIFMTLRSV